MSSGPCTDTLGVAAALVMRSLLEHPDGQTPEEIAAQPGDDAIDAEGARAGLTELEARGLASQGADGRWQLTDAGRTAQQSA
jgi:hypothetical protein